MAKKRIKSTVSSAIPAIDLSAESNNVLFSGISNDEASGK
jgi:hypothetical protein